VRCLAMGFHPSKARLPGQLLSPILSGPRGPLQICVKWGPVWLRRAVQTAVAPAELIGVAQPGRARFGWAEIFLGQARFLKRQLSLPVSPMSQ
jgi:hypothetical protein